MVGNYFRNDAWKEDKELKEKLVAYVPRDVVYATMTELDQAGLEGRALGSKKKKKGHFTTKSVDKGTETGDMATLHAYLRRNHGDVNPEDTVVYGKSMSN